ncbi:MAG: tyrosine-type recombinase/integrase, partial [Alphaproteobacteria bacterium]|nr:tyrosine-type recombinase/integrase [Alphaproteobacteria bacterium]
MAALILSDAATRFLDHCRIAKRLSANTLRAYEIDLAQFMAHVGASRDVAEIDRDMLRRFARHLFDGRGLKETTVKRRMAALKVMFRWLERDEAIELSPFHRLDLTIRLPRRLPRCLTLDEMRRLLRQAESEATGEAAGHQAILLHFVIVCLFATGLRIGELVGVRQSDVDPEARGIAVRGKGDRERKVYLPNQHALTTLTRYNAQRARLRSTDDRLLLTDSGTPATAQSIRRALIALADRAAIGRRVTPHMLRHTAATQLIEAGVDIRFVQKLLGHASIATTQIYTQVSDASLRAVLERADTLGRVGG